MNKQKIASFAKGFLGITGGAGTGFIIGNIVAATTPPGTKVLARLCINIASVGISGMVATTLNSFTDVAINELFNTTIVIEEKPTVVVDEQKDTNTEKDSE